MKDVKDINPIHKLDPMNLPQHVPPSVLTYTAAPAAGWAPNTMVLKVQIGLSLLQRFATQVDLEALGYVSRESYDAMVEHVKGLEARLTAPAPSKPTRSPRKPSPKETP